MLLREHLELKARARTVQTSFHYSKLHLHLLPLLRQRPGTQQTQKDPCTQPLPSQAQAMVAPQCPACTGWEPAAQAWPVRAAPPSDPALPSPSCPHTHSSAQQPRQQPPLPHNCPWLDSSMSSQCHPPARDLGHHSVPHHHRQLNHFPQPLQLGQAAVAESFVIFPPRTLC